MMYYVPLVPWITAMTTKITKRPTATDFILGYFNYNEGIYYLCINYAYFDPITSHFLFRFPCMMPITLHYYVAITPNQKLKRQFW